MLYQELDDRETSTIWYNFYTILYQGSGDTIRE